MSYSRALIHGQIKASPGAVVEIVDGNVLPMDGFGRIELELNQPGYTIKMKTYDVAYLPRLSQNLVLTLKTLEQRGKSYVYYKTKAVLGFPAGGVVSFNFCPRKGLHSTIDVS